MSVPLSDTRLTEAAKRALAALEDLIADSRDPGVEALGARYELAHALGQVSSNELPLDEEGFASQRMEAENFRKLFHSARDRADNLAERVAELQDRVFDAESKVRAAETVKCWTNEDGRRFVFAEDLAFALGYTTTTAKES